MSGASTPTGLLDSLHAGAADEPPRRCLHVRRPHHRRPSAAVHGCDITQDYPEIGSCSSGPSRLDPVRAPGGIVGFIQSVTWPAPTTPRRACTSPWPRQTEVPVPVRGHAPLQWVLLDAQGPERVGDNVPRHPRAGRHRHLPFPGCSACGPWRRAGGWPSPASSGSLAVHVLLRTPPSGLVIIILWGVFVHTYLESRSQGSLSPPGPRRGAMTSLARTGNAGTLLRVEGVSKAFGGFAAVQDVSLTVEQGQMACIIGRMARASRRCSISSRAIWRPTTVGVPSRSRHHRGPPPRGLQLGMGRSFQRTNIFPRLSVFENVQVAVLRITGSP